MLNNNYYDIAMDDLYYLQDSINTTHYNQHSVLCQQIVEKLLKSVAELVCTDEVILKTHNLKLIYNNLLNNDIDLNIDIVRLTFLKDFYFDVMYPGDNFEIVTKRDYVTCINIMYNVVKAINDFRMSKSLPINDYKIILPY